jgi:iron complex outermembrane recepter protein
MKHYYFLIFLANCAVADDLLSTPIALAPLTVEARGLAWGAKEHIVSDESLRLQDAAEILRNLPGAAVVRNGPQTGIAQIRGLSGDRVSVQVDGRSITPACPNHMDPPLHYAGLGSGDSIELFAGISPVSEGGDAIGGVLRISRPEPEFADIGKSLFSGNLAGTFRGDQDSWSNHSEFAAGTEWFRTDYRGSYLSADDLKFPGGTVSASGFESQRHDVVGAWRTTNGFLALEAGLSRTRDAGTPALSMDMVEDDSWHFDVQSRESLSWGTWKNHVYLHDIEHLMDNFSLRSSAMPMQAPATSRDYGWRSDVILPRGDTKIRAGLDLHRNEFDSYQIDGMGMHRDTFEINRRSKYGAYFDLEHEWSPQWSTRAGVRTDIVRSEAGRVDSEFGPPPVEEGRVLFNSQDRSFTDPLLDATAAVRFNPDSTTIFELSLAMKNRAPSLVERYLWTPANASAGLADGRTYLGNLNLDPETAFEIGLGVTKNAESWSASLTPFYQIVSDYIQGVPIERLDEMGRQVLQFQNLERADLYGLELEADWEICDEFSLSGTTSYVRGRNKDSGDDLYRIAPLRGLVDLEYRKSAWEGHLEWVWAASQNHVSEMQGEQKSPGYGLLNLRGARSFGGGIRIEVGIENLFDKRYADHLGGTNRVSRGDLEVGQKVPGAGRFAYTSVNWSF